jgi:hypothetical protein
MRLPFQSKPKSLADRAQAAVGDAADLARSIPERLEGGRERALAVAGAAAGVAAGLAFWRSRADHGPSAHQDPAKPATPWKAQGIAQRPPERASGAAKSATGAAAQAAGTRSK